jgi:hypothetical protein
MNALDLELGRRQRRSGNRRCPTAATSASGFVGLGRVADALQISPPVLSAFNNTTNVQAQIRTLLENIINSHFQVKRNNLHKRFEMNTHGHKDDGTIWLTLQVGDPSAVRPKVPPTSLALLGPRTRQRWSL